jgi:DnaJ-class molecular chaperone
MAHVHTHYDNLKVARDAPPEVIRAAYKSLCQKYHPDRHGDSQEAIRVIQIINSAYSVLSDPAKRREHDEWILRTEAQANTRSHHDPIDFVSGHSVRMRTRKKRSRHRSPFDFLHSHHHRSSHTFMKAVQKALLVAEQLTKKLFRKV